MAMTECNLIINDDYILENTKNLAKSLKKLDEVYDKYLIILKNIHSNAITYGETSDALKTFENYASRIKDMLSDLGESLENSGIEYIESIDNADQYLF